MQQAWHELMWAARNEPAGLVLTLANLVGMTLAVLLVVTAR